MSKYTTEVRYICEEASGLSKSLGNEDVEAILEHCWNKVVDFNFPIFDEQYRKNLVKKILRHYYTREIGFETVGLWKLKLNAKLNDIMPYYNQLYESQLLEFNPFYDVDYTKSGQRVNNGSSNANGTSQNTTDEDSTVTLDGTKGIVNKFSDTPQGGLSGINTDTYLTNATIQNEDTDNTTTTDRDVDVNRSYEDNRTAKNTEDYLEHVVGKMGVKDYSTLLMKYRQTFLNIDALIIEELNDLFIGLWD